MACTHGGCGGNRDHRGDDHADEPRSTEEVAPAKCCGGHRADEAAAQEPSSSRSG